MLSEQPKTPAWKTVLRETLSVCVGKPLQGILWLQTQTLKGAERLLFGKPPEPGKKKGPAPPLP